MRGGAFYGGINGRRHFRDNIQDNNQKISEYEDLKNRRLSDAATDSIMKLLWPTWKKQNISVN